LESERAAAICSVTALFVDPGSGGVDFAQQCATLVQRALFDRRGTLKEHNLILYVLNAIHHHMLGNYGQLWVLIWVCQKRR
jgi:hypothetical protein